MRLSVLFLLAATVAATPIAKGQAQRKIPELRAEQAFEAARKQGPLSLRAFLAEMPKGADLHNHLSGAVYAESWLRAASQDGLCIDAKELKFAKPDDKTLSCPDGETTAAGLLAHLQAPANQALYDKLVDAFSMRAFVPSEGWNGHDQFFSTFDHFAGTDKRHTGEWVDEVATRAAAQNEQYMELMVTPGFGNAIRLARQIGWNPDLAQLRKSLLDAGLGSDAAGGDIAAADELTAKANSDRLALEHCGSPMAAPACQVQVRYIYQVLRDFPPEQVFAQTLVGFETIQKGIDAGHPVYVGINFVQPEDGLICMRDFTLQMRMLDYLHSVYPKVPITMHAGELAPGLVPPEGLLFHIRQAVEMGHALRIGHGVDVMYETDPYGLLKEMAARHVMVEINLTSNDGILGIKGAEHPLMEYRRAGVPVSLSTDDEGVSRSDITQEYLRAAEEYPLNYLDLKQMARTGMEHNFLPGPSLWASPDQFTLLAGACKGQVAGSGKPSAGCQAYLDSSEKAAAQWELERRLLVFERKF